MPELRLHNSLTRRREVFAPIDPAHVRLYVCGPTVYDLAHLGNARPVVVFDVLFRLLRKLYGAECVTYVRNITDVDDKINARAAETGESISTITARTTEDFHQDVAALNALPPDKEPRATEHIPEMIAIIERLIAGGHAYAAEGHVLFSVGSDPEYGVLSGRSPDELIAGARVDVAPYKRDPGDFVLWKPSTPDLPGWESPWGRGRPGWHIECSAMSWRYLGETFDIHGGGQDLIFPHHENELAQSCCAFPGSRFARVWLHNGMLLVDGQKMSKSLGNFVTIRDALARADNQGELVRFFLLKSHYRSGLDYTSEAVHAARRELNNFYQFLKMLPSRQDEPLVNDPLIEKIVERVVGPIYDDLNVPGVIANLHTMRSVALAPITGRGDRHAWLPEGSVPTPRQWREVFLQVGQLLGVLQMEPNDWFHNLNDSVTDRLTALDSVDAAVVNAEIDAKIASRNEARARRDFASADAIRTELAARGILLEDGPNGTTWRRA